MKHSLIISIFFTAIFISCNKPIKQDNSILLNAYHKQILKTTPDSVLIYITKCDALITPNLPDSILAENSYLKGYYFNRIKRQADSSYQYYNKAISFSKDKIQHKREVNYFLNLAETYLNNDKNVNALATINKFEKLIKNTENNLDNLQRVYDFKKQYYAKFNATTKQLKYISLLDKLFKKTHDTLNVFLNTIDRSDIYLKNKKDQLAIQLLDSLSNSLNQLKHPYAYYTLFLKQGNYAFNYKKHNIALKKYKAALFYLKKDKYKIENKLKIQQLYLKIFETAINAKKYQIAQKYEDTISRFRLNNSLKKSFLQHKIIFNYSRGSHIEVLQKELNDFFVFLNKIEKNRVDTKLYELEKLTNREQKLVIKNQQTQLKNEILKKRQYLLLSLSLFFASVIFYLYRLYKHRKKIAFKNELLLEQRLLSAQINPHFASNVLFSIHSFIKTDPDKASNYLIQFSKLFRQSLTNSLKNYITLDAEIALLKNYLDLQLLHFPNRFDYTIELSAIPTDNGITIPPMLIQPFVENAIMHGIIPQQMKGKISIQFSQKTQYLLCIITDNGVGINTKSLKKSSISSELIKKLLSKKTPNPVLIRSNTENIKGTIVYLKIPYKINFN